MELKLIQNTNIKLLFTLLQSNVKNAKDNEGKTSLHFAAVNCCGIDVVEFLIKNGANTNAKDIEGNTPLHFAAKSLEFRLVVECLIKNDADINAMNLRGRTALHQACLCIKRSQEFVKLLIEKGA